jgi:hypothetical protein
VVKNKKIIVGLLIFVGFLIAQGNIEKKTKDIETQMKTIQIPSLELPQPQPVYPRDELKSRIMEDWIRKCESLGIEYSVEAPKEENPRQIGEIKGEKIVLKSVCPIGLERKILNTILEMKEKYPVLLESCKMTATDKGESIEIGYVVFGS